MKKESYDRRLISEVINEIISRATEQGDLIEFTVVYRKNPKHRPAFLITTTSYSADKQRFKADKEDISDWLPENCFWYDKDNAGNDLLDSRRGFSSWREYMVTLRSYYERLITRTMYRKFKYQESSE